MKFIIGKKIGMTQKYQPSGASVPVTEISAEPCFVLQVKTKGNDGYYSVQLGCGNAKHINKPGKGHMKGKKFSFLKEFRFEDAEKDKFKTGDIISIANFAAGDTVTVTGISKGKGFQGVVKRHGFKGQPSTHGHKDQERMPGTSGAGGKQHVFPGKRMPGRMGGSQITIQNLEVIEVDEKKNTLFIKGAVPGAINSMIWLKGVGEIKVAERAPESAKPEEQKPAEAAPAVIAEEKKESKS
jgi:large subunit ribosomal protein L3